MGYMIKSGLDGVDLNIGVKRVAGGSSLNMMIVMEVSVDNGSKWVPQMAVFLLVV